MRLDHQHPGHIAHPAHLAHPSSQIMGMDIRTTGDMLDMTTDSMALGDTGAQTQAMQEAHLMQGDTQAVDHPAPMYPPVLP